MLPFLQSALLCQVNQGSEPELRTTQAVALIDDREGTAFPDFLFLLLEQR